MSLRVYDFYYYLVKTCISRHFHKHEGDENFSLYFYPSISDLKRSKTHKNKNARHPTPSSHSLLTSPYLAGLSGTTPCAIVRPIAGTTAGEPLRQPLMTATPTGNKHHPHLFFLLFSLINILFSPFIKGNLMFCLIKMSLFVELSINNNLNLLFFQRTAVSSLVLVNSIN